jgi:hypothetical protein
MKIDISDLADNIKTKDEFQVFLKAFIQELKQQPDSWDNKSLPDFLEGLYGFTMDLSGYYKNQGITENIDRPTWSTFANILLAAKNYE